MFAVRRSPRRRRVPTVVAALGAAALVGPIALVASPASAVPARHAAATGVEAVAPAVTTAPVARVGVPYLARLPQVAGGSWTALAPTLPPGLTFDAHAGIVIGLPRVAGSWPAVLERRQGTAGGLIAARIVRISVLPAAVSAYAAARATATTGGIAGVVSSASGTVVHGCVEAVSADGRYRSVLTSASGQYGISGLSPGIWEVEFSGCGLDYETQWWPAQQSQVTAQPVVVAAGRVHSGVSARLAAGGEISGTVTAAGSSHGLGSVCVYAMAADAAASISSAVTAPSGAYTLAGLPTGQYLVDFDPCSPTLDRLGQWWKGQAGFTDASVVSVTAGKDTSGISGSLAPAGGISGTVTDKATGKPVAGVCVEAEAPVQPGDQFGLGGPGPLAPTDSSGHYLLQGLAPGDYLVDFTECGLATSLPYLLPALWHSSGDPTKLPPVVVAAGKVTPAISIALAQGGGFSGTVTTGSGKPLAGVCVFATVGRYGLTGSEAVTGADGSYLLNGLPSGTYGALFQPCAGQDDAPARWHGGATFTVTAGKVTGGISGALPVGGEIRGAVVSSTGKPLTGLCVILSNEQGNVTETVEEGPSGFAGTFTLPGLSPGDYSVGFSGSCEGQDYATTYWDGGKYFTVAKGQVISVAMTLPPGGEITGTLTTAAGQPLSGVCVLALPSSLTAVPDFGQSVGGTYALVGLSSGSYGVEFTPCSGQNLLTTLYANGNPVAVKVGKTTSGISASLAAGGIISGTVTSASGTALSYLCVDAISSTVGFGVSTVFGTYSISGLPPGSYKVKFAVCGAGEYATQWWKDAATKATATPIQVTAGSTASGIDAVMQS